MVEHISLNVREALQTPGDAIAPGISLLDPHLEPPAELDYEELNRFLPVLHQHPSVSIELPNPISSPSTARRLKSTLDEARRVGVIDQVALHVRLNMEDVRLAVACGTQRIHVFAGTKTCASGSMDTILNNIHDIATYSESHGVTFIRASLEHASECEMSTIETFVAGLGAINRSVRTPIIRGLGLPDTGGVGTPELYEHIVRNLQVLLRQEKLLLFFHLHDDGRHAMETYESVLHLCQSLEITCCTEATPASYPGERVGIRPTIEEIADRIPFVVPALLQGPSWISKGQSPEDAKRTHVAGVHTKSMASYSSGDHDIPHPGLYAILGTTNIAVLAELAGHQFHQDLLKSTALLAREYASQSGYDKQGRLLALIEQVSENPEGILHMIAAWRDPSHWIDGNTPNLENVRTDRLTRQR